MIEERNRVCPVELAGSLDGRVRGWLQNPGKILAPYVREGMTVLDVGCGPGFFSIGFGVGPLFADERFDAPATGAFLTPGQASRMDAEAIWNALN